MILYLVFEMTQSIPRLDSVHYWKPKAQSAIQHKTTPHRFFLIEKEVDLTTEEVVCNVRNK